MIFSALAAVAIGWLLRDFWLAFVTGLAVSFVSAIFNWLVYSGQPDLNDFQFRTILAGFLAGALGVVVAFLRTAYDEYRAETRAVAGTEDTAPSLSTAMRRQLTVVDARMKRLGHDVGNLGFLMVDRWVNRATYRDAGRE